MVMIDDCLRFHATHQKVTSFHSPSPITAALKKKRLTFHASSAMSTPASLSVSVLPADMKAYLFAAPMLTLTDINISHRSGRSAIGGR